MIVHVVTGPPCSGKSTYVRDNYDPATDVIVDLDRIAESLGAPTHSHGDRTAAVDAAMRLRSSALKWARETRRSGVVYVIDTDGTTSVYDRRTDLDPGIDVCIARARVERRPETVDSIRSWYAARSTRRW